ncbi:drug/metabolite transporter (DMT)-like permease [Parabacteroides sp. PFB2-10]|uniref:DMT family transporter n=1 Tax=Parabacteroides sp. PFB2-10 TaxID=1742405 RepID=UPI0024766098|nr:DMT family transporter [Parabacteroides sp. PFB2-10]MDH6313675.1 drug/metabolite transporter (DMT)-like permease [Parabacteroides sp. PFB2-10]
MATKDQSIFIKLHLSILLAGFTGLFGRLITLNEGLLVFYRMLFAALLLYPILRLTKTWVRVRGKEMWKIAATGCLLGLHWVFFFGSIKLANISIGVICFSLTSFFTALLEPLLLRRRFSWRELALSLLTVCGIALIFQFDTRYRTGILFGVASAALAALFTITNKKVAVRHASSTMLFYEMVGGCLMLVCLMPFYLHFSPVASLFPGTTDLLWLFILALFCTIGLYMLQIEALKSISAFTVNLSYNLEPIYSIILAMLFFGEARELTLPFYAGLGLIFLSVFLQSRKVGSEKKSAIKQ